MSQPTENPFAAPQGVSSPAASKAVRKVDPPDNGGGITTVALFGGAVVGALAAYLIGTSLRAGGALGSGIGVIGVSIYQLIRQSVKRSRIE
jgi:hypothetical protein